MPPSSLLGCSSKSLLRALQLRLGKHLGPFQKREKHFFFAFFFLPFLRVIFHRGFGWNGFIGALGGNGSFGALGGRFEACASKELERGIRRKAAASPLSGAAVGGAKPSGLCEVISYVFKNENLH